MILLIKSEKFSDFFVVQYILYHATIKQLSYFIADEHLLLFIGQRTYNLSSSVPVILFANSNLKINNFSVSYAGCILTLQLVNRGKNGQNKTQWNNPNTLFTDCRVSTEDGKKLIFAIVPGAFSCDARWKLYMVSRCHSVVCLSLLWQPSALLGHD